MDKIGSISACINGDWRYASRIVVSIGPEKLEGQVEMCYVQLLENGATGGMDGPGGSDPYRVTKEVTCDVDAGKIVKAIKSVINGESPAVIKQYGKPTKRFNWTGLEERGLSVRLCQKALEQYWCP